MRRRVYLVLVALVAGYVAALAVLRVALTSSQPGSDDGWTTLYPDPAEWVHG